MTFQEMLKLDRDEVIFNLNELATTHTIDEEEYDLVQTSVSWQDARMSYGSTKATLNPKETAINTNIYTLYLKTEELKRKFTANSVITYDGKKMFVNDVREEGGITKVIIGVHRTR